MARAIANALLRVSMAVVLATFASAKARATVIPGDMGIIQTVTPSGASAATIPIPILPGAGGLEPKLFLSYSSQGGNSGIGLGWSLGGYSTIVRGAKTREVDGAPGPIQFDANDAFYLDGDRLVPVQRFTPKDPAAPDWAPMPYGGTEYRKFVDDGTRAYQRLDAAGGIQDFWAESKTGLRTRFGTPVTGKPTLAAPAAYLATETSDTAGNYISWEFETRGLAYELVGVAYTGLKGADAVAPFARIDLKYEKAPRTLTTHLLGQALERSRRLVSIRSTLLDQSGAAAKGLKVSLEYAETEKADAYYLERVRTEAFDDTLPPTQFSYLSKVNTWTQVGDLNLPVIGGDVPVELTYKLGTASDRSGNPTTALFLSRMSNGQPLAKTYILTTAKWEEALGAQAPPLPFVDNQGHSTQVVALDLDGDGRTDLVQSDAAGTGVTWIQFHDKADPTADRWVRDSAHDNPLEPFVETDGTAREVRLIDLGHPRKDVVVREAGGRHVVLLNEANSWKRNDAAFGFSVDPSTQVVFGDFNCDGADDRAQLIRGDGERVLAVFAGGPNGWSQMTGAPWQWKTSASGRVAISGLKIDRSACQSLLISVGVMGAAEEIVVLEGMSGGWAERQVRGLGPLFSTPTGAALHPELVDLDGDCLDDAIVSETAGGVAMGETWRQSPRAADSDPVIWTTASGLTSKVQIADFNGRFSDTVIAPWRYSGKTAAILTIPSARNSTGKVWLTSGTDWQPATDLAPTTPLNQTKQSGEFYRFVDVDNDGRQDLIYNDDVRKGAELNKAAGWVPAAAWTPPRALSKTGDLASRATVVDVDGDGYMDLVYAYKSADEKVTEVRLNNKGNGWLAADAVWVPPEPMADTQRGDLGWRFADVSADGRVDLVQASIDDKFRLSGRIFLGTALGWKEAVTWKPSVAFVFDSKSGRTLDLGTQIIDMDGDRQGDLVASYRDPLHPHDAATQVSGVYLNKGGSFGRTPEGKVPALLSPYFGSGSVSFVDADSDGNADIVQFTDDKAVVYLGNGKDWDAASDRNWKLPEAAHSKALGFGATRFVDMNGDGRLDILFIRPDARGVIANTGEGWLESPTSIQPLPAEMPAFLTEAGDDAGVRLVDVTGHGALDLVKSAKSESAARIADRATWRNPGERQGMLASLTESTGIITAYTYLRLVDSDGGRALYTRPAAAASSYPDIPLTPFSPVVAHTLTEEGGGRNIERTYGYNDFRFDLANGRVLGFRNIEQAERASDRRDYRVMRRTEYLQYGNLAGRPKAEETLVERFIGRYVVERTEKDWNIVRQTGASNPLGGVFAFLQPVLSRSLTEARDLNGDLTRQVAVEFLYDDWLNPLTIKVDKPNGATHLTVNRYRDPSGGTRYAKYGRSSSSTVEVRDGGGSLAGARTSVFTYAPGTLLPESETLDLGDDELGYRKSYARNARGDIVRTTQEALVATRRARPGGGSGTGIPARTTEVEYDAQGRLITARIRGKTQRTTVRYAPGSIGLALAMPTSETDPNGLTVRKDPDPLGRPALLAGPDGIQRTVERVPAGDVPSEWTIRLASLRSKGTAARSGRAEVRRAATALSGLFYAEARRIKGAAGGERLERATLYDQRGHALRIVTPRTDGRSVRLSFRDFQYDVRGRLIAESAPYFAGDTPYWTRYAYDELDRRLSEARANGGVARVKYDGLVQTRTNARGFATVVTFNLDSRPVKVVRADKGVVTLDYDVMERLATVTSPKGLKTRYGYDAAGNRTLIQDPNAGRIERYYDGFGQVREEKLGSQPAFELDFDELGRPARAWREDQVTEWTYDRPGAIGRPDAVTLTRRNGSDVLKYVESYEYDSALRLRRTTTAVKANATLDPILGTEFQGTYTFTYDPFGDLAKVYYPRPGAQPALIVDREYEPKTGQLLRVLDARTAARPVLWRLTAADASGRSRNVQLGNGTREVRGYKAETGRLEALQVFSSVDKLLLQSAYDYDPTGNMTSRKTLGKRAESFGYDAQNHLTNFARSGAATVKVVYDEDDRVRSKTGVGIYHYASDADAARFCPQFEAPPDALCATELRGAVNNVYRYDEFGSLTTRTDPVQVKDGLEVAYTLDHHVARTTRLDENGVPDNRRAAEFYYGPTGQRILSRQLSFEAGLCPSRSKETLHLGLYERVIVKDGCNRGSRLVTDRSYVQGDNGVFLAIDSIDRSGANGPDASGKKTAAIYQHRDPLGSVVMITRADGKVGAEIRYDPWGTSHGDLDSHKDHDRDLELEAAWTRGFTGQDHIPEFGLIHMTGRVYDPALGMFLSVDPLESDPETAGDLNPYLYAHGNPLAITDPSGFGFWEDAGRVVSDVGRSIGEAGSWLGDQIGKGWEEAKHWVGENWREIVTVAVIAVVSYFTAGVGGPAVAAMIAGAAGGATQAALYGGSVQDVLVAGFIGGVIGGISGGIGASDFGWGTKVAMQGFASGVQSEAQGGGFERGFWIGALSRVPTGVLTEGRSGWAVATRIATRATLNGTISQMQGGKFAWAALAGAGLQGWREDTLGARSWVQSYAWFAPGPENDFSAGDLLSLYAMVSSLHSDRGIEFAAQQPNEFLWKVDHRLHEITGHPLSVTAVMSDPAMGGRPGSGGQPDGMWQRPSDGGPNGRRRPGRRNGPRVAARRGRPAPRRALAA